MAAGNSLAAFSIACHVRQGSSTAWSCDL